MAQNISEVFSNFSQKLNRFNKSSSTERTVQPTKDEYYQEKIREKSERFKLGVVSTYRLYRAPFEALGQNSDRAASLDRDEQMLLKAYNLFKSVMDIDKENQDEVGSTFISAVEIASPLTQKASYTDGGQFIYLMAWLYFEQGCSEYMPLFKNEDGKNSLCFVKSGNFHFEVHDKEIFDIIEAEFYS
ncbi:MAG: hypothetical protein KBT11_06330 [Treponema sp.]|nr:hypothetical protein [Candidatus Treponema equifaecale]